MSRPALALALVTAVLTTACCADRPTPRPIREASTTTAARTGFDDPTTVAPDATTTPAAGAADPHVVVTVFSDFQCPYCRDSARIADKLLTHWPDLVQVQYRSFPLETIHPLARDAALAALAAHRQGAYRCYAHALFATQREWRKDDANAFRGRLAELALGCDLDVARFERDLDDPALARAVDADVARARELGVAGTPTYLVDGRPVPHRVTPKHTGEDTIPFAVRRELLEAAQVLSQGGDLATHLRERVIANTGSPEGADWLLDDKRP